MTTIDMFRRGFMLIPGWLNRHRPSGTVTAFMTFFIVCYIVIVKLDSTDRVETTSEDAHASQHPVTKVLRTHVNIIPPKIIEEFAKDNAVTKANYDYYDDVVNTTEKTKEITTGILIESDNERMMKEHLEDNESVIEDNWQNYLDKNNSASKELNVNAKLTGNVAKNRNVLPISNHRHTSDRLAHLPKYVKIFDPLKESAKLRNSISSNQCLLLKTMHGNAPICIHDPEYDEVISGSISNTGTWEPNYLYSVGSVLKLNNEIEFLDLGCNIGVYTILAAHLGHRVVALDPNRANLRLLTKSLSLGGLRDKVTLIWNAISDVRENVTLTDIIGNIGATFVEPGHVEDTDDEHKAFSITLDDLIPRFAGKNVFIKIDVETYELRTLQGGENFFKEVEVEYILMEWIYHRKHETGKDIIEFMSKYGLFPHVNAHHNTKLEPENYHSWPGNVLWIKY
ncbi:uncharacterized protein LOC123524350 [Mercenaria mercenaria]|uniref:uncharacterized protein LOC123524350 n=1 Tax=Mercenaria mercenaria TaxID=6596 RepID=UPI001E1DA505|nr:uncharacterized protein LOC123524350 [Mercenaria mercenaria]